jgi:hypothetical protein
MKYNATSDNSMMCCFSHATKVDGKAFPWNPRRDTICAPNRDMAAFPQGITDKSLQSIPYPLPSSFSSSPLHCSWWIIVFLSLYCPGAHPFFSSFVAAVITITTKILFYSLPICDMTTGNTFRTFD